MVSEYGEWVQLVMVSEYGEWVQLVMVSEYGEWVQLVMVSAWHLEMFYEHPHRTDSDILLFLFLSSNGLIVSRVWIKASAKSPKC